MNKKNLYANWVMLIVV